ncbi:hypothetical protein AB0K21_19770 [Streptosporangium sp. NPDC049248]|uniref:hypothetical protein n=1 Tax=Streptosporangium sp. NPDC049248 TaxID=3155651 RepID=UPI00343CD243
MQITDQSMICTLRLSTRERWARVWDGDRANRVHRMGDVRRAGSKDALLAGRVLEEVKMPVGYTPA